MRPHPAPRRPRPDRGLLSSLSLALILAAFLGLGCGIDFTSSPLEADIFEEMEIDGDFTAGSVLTLSLEYQQPYPVEVVVQCVLLDDEGETELAQLLTVEVGANPNGGTVDEATPVPGNAETQFLAPDEPGEYIVECATVRDDENKIGELIEIEPNPARTPAATPSPTVAI